MKAFATLLNNLYFTYSHHEKSKLLNRYLLETDDPERGYAVAIIANALSFPTFRKKLIQSLIEQVIDPALFSQSLDYVGDLSETLALLWPNPTTNTAPLPKLSEIVLQIPTLNEIELSQYLAELLNRANAIERWALLKLGTGSLRIGVSARFIKKVLADLGNVDVQAVERVWYAVSPPYLSLFSWLLEGKSIEVSNEKMYFHPVMLSHPLKDYELPIIKPEEFILEPKYDGIRVQLIVKNGKVKLFTRTGDEINHAFPDLLDAVNESITLDGELVVRTPTQINSFNDLQQRLNRKTPSTSLQKKLPAAIILYDILTLGDRLLYSLPFTERRETLENWYKRNKNGKLYLSEIIPFDRELGLVEIKQNILQNPQIEGLMIKRKDSLYVSGRPKGLWYKWKRDPFLFDAVLLYAQRGHGKRSSLYSNYTFGLWKDEQLLPIGKAYFGFTDDELYRLDQWIRRHTLHRFGPVLEVKKELVFEVAFDSASLSSRHKSGIALRFPRIHRIRWDKPAQEADQLQTLIDLVNSR
jgi:DNA ligase-1